MRRHRIAADLLACRAALTTSIVSPASGRRGLRSATLGSARIGRSGDCRWWTCLRARAESRRVRVAQQLAETERLADAGEFAAKGPGPLERGARRREAR